MAGITERNIQKQELVNAGYSMRYIDEWQPKTTLYRHKASLTVEGEVAFEVGTSVSGVPGSPDYVLRKSRIGLFPWMPSDSCECRWCCERINGAPQEEPEQEVEDPEPNFSGTASEVLEQMGSTRKGRKMGPHFQSDS
jgi:hypothetical protein